MKPPAFRFPFPTFGEIRVLARRRPAVRRRRAAGSMPLRRVSFLGMSLALTSLLLRQAAAFGGAARGARRNVRRFDSLPGTGSWDYPAKPKTFDPLAADGGAEEPFKGGAGGGDAVMDSLNLMPDEDVSRAIEALEPLLTDARRERLEEVLQQRCGKVTFLFENPANPSNVWACLRSLDAFGVSQVGVVTDTKRYGADGDGGGADGGDREVQKGRERIGRMKSAAGSAQWLVLKEYASIAEAVESIRAETEGVLLLASDLSEGALDINDIDLSGEGKVPPVPSLPDVAERPVVIIMGNEETGISEEARRLSDARYYLPMRGFAESFNLSVATAITLAYLQASGKLSPGGMDPRVVERLRLRWYMHSINKASAPAILRRAGVTLPGFEDAKHAPRAKLMGFKA